MGKIGVYEYRRTDGSWGEIDLYDPGSFPHEPIEIRTSSGAWGVPFLTDPSTADTPFEVVSSSGQWYGINATGGIVEDFEWGGPLQDRYSGASWEFDGASITTTAARTGTYGLRLSLDHAGGTILSLPGDGLLNYPVAGDDFIIWMRSNNTDGSTPLARVSWFAQGYNTDNLYRFNLTPGQVNLQKRRNGSTTGLEQEPVNLTTGSWIGLINRTSLSGGDLTQAIEVVDANMNTLTSFSHTDTSNVFTDGGIAWFSNAQWDIFFDDWGLVF